MTNRVYYPIESHLAPNDQVRVEIVYDPGRRQLAIISKQAEAQGAIDLLRLAANSIEETL